MSHKLTKVLEQPGLKQIDDNSNQFINVTLNTDNVDELEGADNLYYTHDRFLESMRTSPIIQDRHFYTVDELAVKQGDLYWRIISPIKLLQAKAYVGTPSVGADISLHVIKNDSTAPEDLLYDLDITSTTNEVFIDYEYTLAVGDYLRVDVVQVGTTTKGSDLIVSFKYHSIL